MSKILLVGDVHAEWAFMDTVVEGVMKTYGPFDAVIQLGDYGFGPFGRDQTVRGTHGWTGHTPLYVLPGNHENWNTVAGLQEAEDKSQFYVMKRPELLDIAGLSVLAIPGADSIDKHGRNKRPPNQSWWYQEEILEEHVTAAMELYDANGADLILTHCAPLSFVGPMKLQGPKIVPDRVPSSYELNTFYNVIAHNVDYPHPWLWAFGHYHTTHLLGELIPNAYVFGAPILSGRSFYDESGVAVLDIVEETLTVLNRRGVKEGSLAAGKFGREAVINLPPRIINRGHQSEAE